VLAPGTGARQTAGSSGGDAASGRPVSRTPGAARSGGGAAAGRAPWSQITPPTAAGKAAAAAATAGAAAGAPPPPPPAGGGAAGPAPKAATPPSQLGFKHEGEGAVGGEQLTILAVEVHADSRGALLPDPR
jgi:hypothetical protein